ncbi:hypothetical protein BJ165DRAFT_1471805 [Panaeolus papilionaceus]|nr:hypothetical protein BJ165DRAFT_1471805 [Panaeolus papilionaceus]
MFTTSAYPLWRLRPTFFRRGYSTGTHKRPAAEPDDFRPPWVYFGTRLISMVIIPGIGVYSILFYDFGEREHVFQPMRRWARAGLQNFLTLSPAEEKLVDSAKTSEPSQESQS